MELVTGKDLWNTSGFGDSEGGVDCGRGSVSGRKKETIVKRLDGLLKHLATEVEGRKVKKLVQCRDLLPKRVVQELPHPGIPNQDSTTK